MVVNKLLKKMVKGLMMIHSEFVKYLDQILKNLVY